DRNEVALHNTGVDLTGPTDAGPRLLDHLVPLGDPARKAAEGEEDREHLGREAHGAVDQTRVEVHVRVEAARDEVVVGERVLLQLQRDVQQLVGLAEGREDVVRGSLDDLGARVEVLVDPVAEAHQTDAVLLVLHLADEGVDVAAGVADALQHLQHGLVGAAVQRAPERGDTGRDRGEHVRLRGADQADRGGRTVLLVVRVQDEQLVEGGDDDRVELVLLRGDREGHAQEVLDVTEVVARVDERVADRLLVRVRRDRRKLGEQADRGEIALPLVERVVAVLVERRQGADHGGQHRHRVGVPGEAPVEVLDILVQQRVLGDVVLEAGELVDGRQLAVDQQVGDLQEGGALGQLLDRVAAVAEDARLAVQIRDGGFIGGGVPVTAVQGDQTGMGPELPDVEALVADGAVDHRVGVLAVAVPQYYRVVAHVFPHRRSASSSRCPDCLYLPPIGSGECTRGRPSGPSAALSAANLLILPLPSDIWKGCVTFPTRLIDQISLTRHQGLTRGPFRRSFGPFGTPWEILRSDARPGDPAVWGLTW
ncbi:hypothetical protein STRIP9103_03230, partial [Streptomyces ipomoeae 91-03]